MKKINKTMAIIAKYNLKYMPVTITGGYTAYIISCDNFDLYSFAKTVFKSKKDITIFNSNVYSHTFFVCDAEIYMASHTIENAKNELVELFWQVKSVSGVAAAVDAQKAAAEKSPIYKQAFDIIYN